MNKQTAIIAANCFKKVTKNIKDYVPSTIRPENIREPIPLKFPEITNHSYTPELFPNELFPEWPSDEEIKNFDFSNGGKQYNDPDSNLIVFPFSLRKETFTSLVWKRPNDYFRDQNLIKVIQEKYQQKNFNYIKNKIDLAPSNILNYTHEDDSEDEGEEDEDKKEEGGEKKEKFLNNYDNLKVNIKRRNSIDLANAEGVGSSLGNEFFSSRLNEEEKKMYIESKNLKAEFCVVPIDQSSVEENKEVKEDPKNKQINKNVKDQIVKIEYAKLIPSNLNLGIALSDYCRWVTSQLQLLLDNKINIDNDENHFIRRIYPQDNHGMPIYNPAGLYWVKLFHMGKERKIVIDDKFPVHKETFESFLPQCLSPFELWPMILSKALIKLYSYKYRSDSYELEEVGDCSVLYSLTKLIGNKLPAFKFIKYLNSLQQIKNNLLLNENEEEELINNDKDEENKENKENNENSENNNKKKGKIHEVDFIILNNKNVALSKALKNDYDLIIAYINSKYFVDENSKKNMNNNDIYNSAAKGKNYPHLSINIDNIENTIESKFPQIRNKSNLKYTEKTLKIADVHPVIKRPVISRKSILMNKVPQEYQLLYNKLNKFSVVSTKKELDPKARFNKYFEEHRFLTSENIYNNYQKYIIKKTNKIYTNGIICDVGYSLLEIFQSGNFNMKRLKPISFEDMKLDIKIKYKQMTPEEKAAYLDEMKDLRVRQKKEKIVRINNYLDNGTNLLCLKFTNESFFNDKKAFEINTLFNSREIEAAKFCILNDLPFPPEEYFEKTFIPKLTKDEETGEVNFWTKKFYHKLLKTYFNDLEKKIKKLKEEQKKKLEELKEQNSKEEEKKSNNDYIEISEDNDENKKDLLKEYEELCANLNEELKNKIDTVVPGTWMRYESFKDCFDNFILFKKMKEFKYKILVDNIWYNYDKDFYEEKDNSNILHFIKDEEAFVSNNNDNNENNNNDSNKDNIININNNPLEQNEIYILFEPNGEKNKKSVSSEIGYEKTVLTQKGNKFDDIVFSLTITLYEIDANKKINKLSSFSLKNYFFILNLNLSKLTSNKSIKEFFITSQGGLCPFGYNLQVFSNFYNIENYSYNQFLCNFKGFIEKKINIMHPILPKHQYYLMSYLTIELKGEENQEVKETEADDDNNTNNSNNNKSPKLVKFYTNFNEYDDNVIKNNIEVILINTVTNRKRKIYYKKIFELDFSSCSKYMVELSIIPGSDIPERSFEYLILYNTPEIFIEKYEILPPVYIRQKYIPNKHDIIFNELVFPSEQVTTFLDISLEYRPTRNNSENEQTITNYADENLPHEEPLPFNIPMWFYLYHNEDLIFKKDFENQSLIRNLQLKGKLVNAKDFTNNNNNKDNNNNLVYDAYIIKSVLHSASCPSYLKNPSEYKGDIYWRIAVFSTESIFFAKNTMKEDKEKAVKESWEINEPGRGAKAIVSRKKYFANLKFDNGEILSPEEEELISDRLERKEKIECESKMILTNIPPKEGEKSSSNISRASSLDAKAYSKRLPKIKSYCSKVMKNFYDYSNQSRVITKNKNGINELDKYKMLPNIQQFCKSPEQREQELKDIEEKVNNYYEEMKKEDEKRENAKENYYNEIQEMNDKFVEQRQKILAGSNEETGNILDDAIKKGNVGRAKGKEIQDYYDIVFDEQNGKEGVSEENLFEWYNDIKVLIEDINKPECSLSKKYWVLIDDIKKKMGELFKGKITELLLNKDKNEELTKKYKDLVEEKIIIFDDSKETKDLLEKLQA